MKETENEKKLRIALGKCIRLDKDLFYYGKEATEEEAKINEMITANADEYDIKQLKNVLKETQRMIPGVKRDLAIAIQQLDDLLVDLECDDTIVASENYSKAKSFLSEHVA